MIRRMLMTDILKLTKEREEFKKKARDLKKKLGKDNPEYKSKLKELNKESPRAIFLEEDCNLFGGSGFKKGKELVYEEAVRLSDFGYYLVWVSDRPTSDEEKKVDFIYTLKSEMEGILSKSMVLLDEADGKKAGSTIKYIEANDLLKQTIEAIQSDGAKYVAFHIFGEGLGKLNSLKAFIHQFFKKAPETVDLFSNVSLGNIFKYKQKLVEKKIKDKDGKVVEERSNYTLNFMINLGLGFMATIRRIQNERLERDPDDVPDKNRKPDPLKRHGYDDFQLIDAAMAAFFVEYGYLHFTIDNLVQRFTKPFYTQDGQFEGEGIVRLSDKDQLIYDKHANVSYNLMSATKKYGFDSDMSRDILQYHHRGLNDTGYPKRKMIDEKVSQTGADGQVIGVYNQKIYEQKISELCRLTSIVNFYVEYTSHTPFHLPFQRDNVIRHLLINSVYPEDDKRKEDQEGIWDIQTQNPQDKRYDAFLVDRFIKSVNIYKLGEEVPIFNFNNSKKPLYAHAVVERYNEYAHRPVVLIKEGEDEKELDLSLPENESLYIGENIPSLRFQDVIEEFHLDKVSGGIVLSDDNLDDDEMGFSSSKEDQETNSALDDIFGESNQIEEVPDNVEPADAGSIDDLIFGTMPDSISKAKSDEDKEVEMEEKENNIQEEPADSPVDDLADLSFDTADDLSDMEDIVPDMTDDEGQDGFDDFELPPVVEEDHHDDNHLDELDDSSFELPDDEISFEPPQEEETIEKPAEAATEKKEEVDLDKEVLDAEDLDNLFGDPFSAEEESSSDEIAETEVEEAPALEDVDLTDIEAETAMEDSDLADLGDIDLPSEEEAEIPEMDAEELSDSFSDDIDTAEEEDSPLADLETEVEIPDIEEEPVLEEANLAAVESAQIETVSSHSDMQVDDDLYVIYIQHHHEYLPYGLGRLVASNSNEKRFRIRYIAQQLKEESGYYIYNYSLVNSKAQKVISVYNPNKIDSIAEGEAIFFIKGEHQGDFQEKIIKEAKADAYHLLLYKGQNDPKKRLSVEKEQAKYIVQIKAKGSSPDKPEVKFVRYIKEANGKFEYVKDQNCDKVFDLAEYSFFKLGRELSAKEILQILDLAATA